MRIAWVGGVEKSERLLESIAEHAGCTMEFHGGHVGGRGEEKLRAAIARSDLVLIVTEPNSHGAVGVAKKEAHRLGREVIVTKRFGPSRLKQFLEERGCRVGARAIAPAP
ncbi:MAG: DUF2325 domain-containing protein [Polyangiaceae bacterium]